MAAFMLVLVYVPGGARKPGVDTLKQQEERSLPAAAKHVVCHIAPTHRICPVLACVQFTVNHPSPSELGRLTTGYVLYWVISHSKLIAK